MTTMRLLTGALSVACLLITINVNVNAQGTRSDYERADAVQRLTENKVFLIRSEANWLGDTIRFWYRRDCRDGSRAFLVVPGSGHGIGGRYGVRRRRDFFVRHLLGVEPRSEP